MNGLKKKDFMPLTIHYFAKKYLLIYLYTFKWHSDVVGCYFTHNTSSNSLGKAFHGCRSVAM